MKKLLLPILFLFSLFSFGQPIELFRQFNGHLDFTAFGNTLNAAENNFGYCGILSESSATLNLAPGQTFVSAHLYWASIGNGDFEVSINNTPITAQRIFNHSFNGRPYFGAYADVTDLVGATGNGNYTFSDLDVSALLPQYCGTNFGGWAIYVIYEDPTLLLNQISLFDGLMGVNVFANPIEITLTNIDVSSDRLSKIGFLAWEGDADLAVQEALYINNILISDPPLNPSNNAFNGTNSYIGPPGNAQNYNMDLDFYHLEGIVNPGDTSIDIKLTSGQDWIMVHNIITSVNSELPDATIEIDDLGVFCENGNIDVEYTVYNVNSTGVLPPNVPIAFYADDVLIGQSATVNALPIGGSESGTTTLTIPPLTPTVFTLKAVVDDIGDGTGIVNETDETNNEDERIVDLSEEGILLDPGPACIGKPVILESGVTDPPFDIQWYRNTVAIPGATNPTYAATTDGVYHVVVIDGLCRVESNPVALTFRPQPVANPPIDLYQCDYGTTAGTFDLKENDPYILGTQDPTQFTIKYYRTYQDSFDDTNEIVGGIHIIEPPSPQTIYARIEDNSGSCFDLTDFKIYFSRAIAGLVPVSMNFCDADGNGGLFIDLPATFNAFVLDGEPSSRYNITYHTSQGEADTGANPLPVPYFVTGPGERIYIRLENRHDARCFDSSQNVEIIIDTPPVIETDPPNLIMCDDNNDGFAFFELALQTPVITLGDPTLLVTYHGTLTDAENGVLPLPASYENDHPYLDIPITDPTDPEYGTGGVWARVASSTSSCKSIVPFALEVRFSPVGTTPAEPLRACGENDKAFFDLTVVADEVLGTLDPDGFDLYYFEVEAEAIAAGDRALTNPNFDDAIPDPTNFLNSTNPQDIYILIVGNGSSNIPPNPNVAEGCYDIVTLTIIVDPKPEDRGPFEWALCDEEPQGGIPTATFDLTSRDVLVTGGDPTITVEWFLSYAHEANDDPIPNPTTFRNTATPQTVIGRATSEFGCKTLVTLTLTVLPNPDPNRNPDPLELCDDDDDGIVDGWDLTLADADIIDGQADVTVLYYEDYDDAVAGVPGTEITMPYRNRDPFNQTVYARVFKLVPPARVGCFTIVELELIVIALPDKPVAPFSDPLIGCDESGNGTAIFDLTRQDEGVLGSQDPANFFPITYYEDPDDAIAGINAIPNPGAYTSTGGVTIYVRLESRITGCFRITPFELETELFPTIGEPVDLEKCDDMVNGSTDTDGLSTFNLTLNTPNITLGDPKLTISYYASAVDQMNNNPIVNPTEYQNVLIPQQRIFVTVFSENGCRATTSFLIIVLPSPEAFSPGVIVACDPDNDGFADFDLEAWTDFITDGDPNLSVSYHGTLLNAQNNVLPLPNIYENDEQYFDAPITDPTDPRYGTGGVWVRVESTASICQRILSFALEVHTSPVATEPAEPLRECDINGNGTATFDLTSVADEVLGNLDPNGFDLYYYVDFDDAQTAGEVALTNPDFSLAIGNPGAYPNISNPQDIYILVVGNANGIIPPNPYGAEGCYDIVTLTLIVDPVPPNLGPFTMEACDEEVAPNPPTATFDLTENDILITGGVLGLTVKWFTASGDPILEPTMFQNSSTPQTVIGRVSSEFECSTDVTVTLTVLPNPNPKMDPDPIIFCDINDNGIVDTFDLTVRDAEIIAGQANVSILYYETFEEAEAGLPGTEIVGLYQNIIPYNQTVFARVTNDVPPKILPCFTIVELQLIVAPLPDKPDSNFKESITECDENGNGMAFFDLTVQNDAVIGAQDPNDFEPITYYISEDDAEAGINAIDPADNYESISRTIWVRLESIVSGCVRISSFEIIVGGFPGSGIANDLELCDDEESGSTTDGISVFNLTLNTPVITGGDPTLSVKYYANEDDFNNDIPIANPLEYPNVESPQQEIFVKVLGQNSCGSDLTFFIIVNPNPEPVAPSPLYACDLDNNGVAQFDLNSKTAEIQGGDPNLIITYHETLFDANRGILALASPYENIILNQQTIYVRAAYRTPPAGTGCFTVITLNLIVNPSPEVPLDLPDLVACDESGFVEFDLTDQEDLIYGSQPKTDYTLTYHLNEADAIAGVNWIVEPDRYTNISNPQTIWVRLDDNFTECFAIGQFNLVVKNGLPITDPEPLVLCDDLGEENDGITTFDLTVKNSEITNGVMTQGVSYFLTEEDAEANINRIDPDTAYVNMDANGNAINPQVLFVRVEDSDSDCISFTTLTIRVVPNPTPAKPDPIELCDYNVIVPPGPYDEVELFDLTSRNTQILKGNNWTINYFESYLDAVNDEDAIPVIEHTSYQNKSNPQIIYVKVTNPNSLCFEIVELELIVNPVPDDTAIVTPYIVCAPDDSEIGIFNLETKVDEILGGQPQPPFKVTFYLTPEDAENQTAAIVNTTAYQNKDANNNPINPQTIYTGIMNMDTGCYIGGMQSFDLMVQKGAIANTPAEPFVICDNLPPSDGFAEFDLNDVSNQQVSALRAEILGGQDPNIFSITFHETLEGAEAGTGAITFPYVNIINPQRIYVRVTNDDNLFEPKCYAVTDMILKVDQLPEVILDGNYRLCVDENGNPVKEEEGGASPPVIDTGLDPNLFTFVWELNGVIIVGENGPSIIAVQPGEYTVTYTEIASNCEASVTVTVTVSSAPFTYGANLLNGAFAGNHVIEVMAEGEGIYVYSLDNGPFQDSNIFENVPPGNHLVTIKDKYGCGSVTFEVGVIDYPPYFTPNNDGYHDTWNIIGIAAGDPTAKIYIFDRFGKLLKQLSPLGPGWDGTYGGNPMPSSDYWFRVEYTEGGQAKEFKGHFTLKR